MNHFRTETMHPDTAVTAEASALNPVTARSLVGFAGRPTIVSMGPFDAMAIATNIRCSEPAGAHRTHPANKGGGFDTLGVVPPTLRAEKIPPCFVIQ